MKIKNLLVLLGLLAMVAVRAGVPTVGGSFTSAADYSGQEGVNRRSAAPAAVANATVTVTPVLLPSETSPNWNIAAEKVVNDALTGRRFMTGSVTNPGNYAVTAPQKLEWFNLAESTGPAQWRGQLNPPAPFHQERGQLLWHLIDVQSEGSLEDVSMSQVVVSATSLTDGDILRDTVDMATKGGYGPRAVGIKADGTRIASGSAGTTKANRVLLLVRTIRFNGGGTVAGLKEIETWVNGNGNYSLKVTATVGGVASGVATNYLVPPPLPPVHLMVDRNGKATIHGAKVGALYRVQVSASHTGTTWHNVEGTIEAGETIQLNGWGATSASGMGFARAVYIE